jgi:type IV pilus assembly protein PilX
MEPLIVPFVHAGKNQSGVALIMVLIMLTAMTIAGVALVRIVDSANVISGNFAFRQATLSIADLGIEAAALELKKIIDDKLMDKPNPVDCETKTPSNCHYFPARSIYSPVAADTMVDAKGLPKKGNIDGSKTQEIDWSVKEPVAGLPSEYFIRYVIDRQCNVSPVTSPVDQCINETPQGGGSKRSGATVFVPRSTIFYRVSIQVTGPRKTQSHVQVILGF